MQLDQLKKEYDSLSKTKGEAANEKAQRQHLGASEIGDQCEYFLWLKYRWFFNPDDKLDGRRYRLLERGKNNEPKIVNNLRELGFKVKSSYEEPENPIFKKWFLNGHFGGECDGFVKFPDRYKQFAGQTVGLELKTSSTGKGFSDLFSAPISHVKPRHADQMNTYFSEKFENVLYFVENKNDDDIFAAVFKTSKNELQRIEAKASNIIFSTETPPRKISQSETYYLCKMCDAHEVCWWGDKPAKNCRTCKYSRPSPNPKLFGKWVCLKNEKAGGIPYNYAKEGCSRWEPLK